MPADLVYGARSFNGEKYYIILFIENQEILYIFWV